MNDREIKLFMDRSVLVNDGFKNHSTRYGTGA
jgi:hypothetical protein